MRPKMFHIKPKFVRTYVRTLGNKRLHECARGGGYSIEKYLIQHKYAFYWFDVAAAAATTTAKAADERWIIACFIALTRLKIYTDDIWIQIVLFSHKHTLTISSVAPIRIGRIINSDALCSKRILISITHL